MTIFISLDSILSIPSVFLLSPIMTLAATTKDYYEIIHKLMELHPNYSATDYSELGTLITYAVLTFKRFCIQILTFDWLQNIWSLPIIVPDIASAMISEVSVLDGYLHNAFTFLETPLAYGKTNFSFYGLEKFFVGFINSFFLFLPTSAAHIIFFRRLVFQGIAGGYVAGVGIIAGNILWFASIIFGWRFFVIPWLSLDILRYFLGFIILIKFMYHTSRDKRILGNLSKSKIFLINFLLAFTEQTNIYPFVTNMSVGAESSILETFPVDNLGQFIFIHTAYLFGLLVGSFTLLNLTCWIWENPVAKIYKWLQNNVYMPNLQKNLNLFFLYVLMVCTISSFPYYGLDYTVTNPLGFVADDRFLTSHTFIEGKKKATFPELAFLTSKAWEADERQDNSGDRVVRRWKNLLRVYKGMDTTLYNKGVYNNLLTLEDLNYGFDKAWLRRRRQASAKRFQLNEPFKSVFVALRTKKNEIAILNKESARATGFGLTENYFYSPNFHKSSPLLATYKERQQTSAYPYELKELVQRKFKSKAPSLSSLPLPLSPFFPIGEGKGRKKGENKELDTNTPYTDSVLRKVIRKINTRIKSSEIRLDQINSKRFNNPIYSKRWKQILSPEYLDSIRNKGVEDSSFPVGSLKMKMPKNDLSVSWQKNPFPSGAQPRENFSPISGNQTLKKQKERLSKKDRQLLRYKTTLALQRGDSPIPFLSPFPSGEKTGRGQENGGSKSLNINDADTMLHPIKFYLQKEKAFSRKLKFYGASVFRKLSVENNAPHFRTIMKRVFPYFKPTRRYIHTIKAARIMMGRPFRKQKSRVTRKRVDPSNNSFSKSNSTRSQRAASSDLISAPFSGKKRKEQGLQSRQSDFESDLRKQNSTLIQTPPTFSIEGKKASRLRNIIFKHALFSWYYTPFNRALSKLDIDSFIRRQPNSHFLTKKDEQGLHLKRFLLSDHYETLRWYTYMQHYRAMKTKIGGTKSFASKFVYNQQFHGTLKKVRHLFAITPSLFSYADKELPASKNSPFDFFLNKKDKPSFKNKSVLKFDQPLYNEYSNSKTKSILNESVTHEELLSPYKNKTKTREIEASVGSNSSPDLFPQRDYFERKKDDFITFSTSIVREYLKAAKPIRKATIKQLILKKNYKELSQFLLSGQKIRGIRPTTNQGLLLRQEKDSMMPFLNPGSENLKTPGDRIMQILSKFSHKIKEKKLHSQFKALAQNLKIEDTDYFTLLTEYKNGLYNKKTAKNERGKGLKLGNGYTASENSLFESRYYKEQLFKLRLDRLKKWLALNPSNSIFSTNKKQEVLQQAPFELDSDSNPENNAVFLTDKKRLWTTGLKKALKESVPASSNPSLLRPVSPIYAKLTEKEEGKSIFRVKHMFNLGQRFVGATFVRSKGVSTLFKDKIKEIFDLILDKPTSFLKLKARPQKSWSSPSKRKRKHYARKMLNAMRMQSPKQKFRAGPGKAIGARSRRQIRNQQLEQTFRSETEKEEAKNAQSADETNPFATFSSALRIQGVGPEGRATLRAARNAEEDFSKNYTFRKNRKNYSQTKDRQKGIKDPKLAQEKKRKKKKEPLLMGDGYAYNDYNDYFSYLFTPFNKPGFMFLKKNKKSAKQEVSINSNPIKGPPSHRERKRVVSLKDKPTDKEFLLNEGFNSHKNNSRELNYDSDTSAIRARDKPTVPQRRSNKYRRSSDNRRRYYAQSKNKHLNRLTKKIKQVQSSLKFQQWWWESFGPSNYQATLEVDWQLTKNRYLENLISRLSKNTILERDYFYNLKNTHPFVAGHKKQAEFLQIGDYDFKPLAIPQAFRIRDILTKLQKKNQSPSNETTSSFPFPNKVKNKLLTFFKKQNDDIFLPTPLPPSKQGSNRALEAGGKVLLSFQTRIRKIFRSEKTPPLIKKLYEKVFEPTSLPLEIPSGKTSSLVNTLYEDIFNFTLIDSLKARKLNSVNIKEFPKAFLPFQRVELGDNDSKMSRFASLKQLSFLIEKRISKTPRYNYNSFYKPVELSDEKTESKFMVNSNPLPFYAGWDESLRKFVVTNRLLSRRDAGYSTTLPPLSSLNSSTQGEKIEFSHTPFQGLNKGTTLFYELPFVTFASEQLSGKGVDAFAPIGWRRLDFRHSIFKTEALNSWLHRNDSLPLVQESLQQGMERSAKDSSPLTLASPLFSSEEEGKQRDRESNHPLKPLLIKKILTKSDPESKTLSNNLNFIYKLQQSAQLKHSSAFKQPLYSYDAIKNSKNYLRNFLKRTHDKDDQIYRQTRDKPPFLKTGPLIHEVLPMHYVMVFARTDNRALKDRYLNRRGRMQRNKADIPKTVKEFSSFSTKIATSDNNYDFTFRRRVKTRRSPHRKLLSAKTNNINPRRRRFITDVYQKNFFNKSEDIYQNGDSSFAPSTSLAQGTNYSNFRKKLKRRRPQTKSSKKARARNQQLLKEALRKRLQSRRQIFRQVINIKQKSDYSPQAGGFVWPGDYLRLETVQTPKLVLQNKGVTEILRKFKEKRSFSEVSPQPRDYLLENHNVKVLKKKLEKAHHSNQIKQRIKQLKVVYQ